MLPLRLLDLENRHLILKFNDWFRVCKISQGSYYNILPTPNWYDNHSHNYSSYNERRWGAHSGSDSDDLLVFMGFIGKK